MRDTINAGDRVNVFFENAEAELNVKVVDLPGSATDCWRIRRMDGTLVLVQTYAKIVRTLEAPENRKDRPGDPEAKLAAGALNATHEGARLGGPADVYVYEGAKDASLATGVIQGGPHVGEETPTPPAVKQPDIEKTEESPFKK